MGTNNVQLNATNDDEVLGAKVRNILTDRCHISIDSEDNEQNIHLDSMALMELIVGLENEFNITLETDKLGDFYRSPNIGSISRLVSDQIAVREGKKFWNGEC